MRIIAILATYNERRFIEPCLKHLADHDVEAYLVDNCSTDSTVARAERWLGRGLLGIETFPRPPDDVFDWRGLLGRKEELARELEADWFIHLDPDEVRVPPAGKRTLAEALEEVDQSGFNAVSFREFTFLPTRQEPDHDHPRFQRTLRTYYPFEPRSMHSLKAWKATPEVELSSGGHAVKFHNRRIYPEHFSTKHFLLLSPAHAIEKYVQRRYDPGEVASGWHGWRAALTAADIHLPDSSEMRVARSDDDLDRREPWRAHYLERTTGNIGGPVVWQTLEK